MKIEGLDGLKRALQQEIAKRLASPDAVKGESVVVGYTAQYGVYVHENLEAAHGSEYNAKHADEITQGSKTSRGPNQQAKFLEQPARELCNSGELARDVVEAVLSGEKLQDAILVAAEHIQRASQEIVPVDTGNLIGSSFTQKE